ncbi:hypothetical protein PR202_ga08328 [Eleusine coracana subsp. coracana]|uniref:Crossover junction endonuclease MUS81 n=1 Tax=Eleusine coracana subsp. coracana TaxID=191504 RepID=A0AAV5C2G3_ELECO|nr:hypothetical protein PR202_ga08328 [Eleusine coracana subsp. coracana]
MAPPVRKQFRVMCPENQALSRFFMQKWQSLMNEPDGLSATQSLALANAKRSISCAQERIRTLDDFKEIKGVGRWLTFHMKEFFGEHIQDLSPAKADFLERKQEDRNLIGPDKNTAAYAILITLLRSRTSVARHSPKLVWDKFSKESTEQLQSPSSNYSEEAHRKRQSSESNAMLAMPPRQSNENFLEAYEVVLILDDREKFRCFMPESMDLILKFETFQFSSRLDVYLSEIVFGSLRRREDGTEYVLDYIVERKNLLDLDDSITDNRYKDQKLRLKRCGLRKVIYLVEGDPKSPHVSEKAKTACFTTEILDGFDILRTSGYAETERQYVYLTSSIIDLNLVTQVKHLPVGDGIWIARDRKSGKEYVLDFIVERKNVSDLHGSITDNRYRDQKLRLKVPQVTEEAALGVIELYPTLLSLAQAYSKLDGDTRAQEEMLQNKNQMVNAGASRNIFKLVWADG